MLSVWQQLLRQQMQSLQEMSSKQCWWSEPLVWGWPSTSSTSTLRSHSSTQFDKCGMREKRTHIMMYSLVSGQCWTPSEWLRSHLAKRTQFRHTCFLKGCFVVGWMELWCFDEQILSQFTFVSAETHRVVGHKLFLFVCKCVCPTFKKKRKHSPGTPGCFQKGLQRK